jgi:hypothetical protein
MKAILKFDLEDHDEKMEHLRCIKSTDMALFISELNHNFWRKWKHDETDFNLDNYKEALGDLMEEYNININELID